MNRPYTAFHPCHIVYRASGIFDGFGFFRGLELLYLVEFSEKS